MITATKMLYLYVETPLHAGVGSGLSSIDLPTGCATRLQQASREIEAHFRWRSDHFVSY